ncbi:hypothetical protein NON08_00085 [Cetobacterium somerae]|uniref:hypothetical protein n=1 Tax=Cetobacterium sp. NK01 TaxID=2993530 RepID=UPI002116BCAF|nr:hypothetical protein [Cetobacterium sp. NK01]MCQ8210969.1 hypothetical protein [Cetobacterium sp. NK01]
MSLKKLISIFFLISNFIFALEIQPTMFEQRIDGSGGYREFIVSNNTNSTLRYKLTIFPGSKKDRDMSKWTEVSPKILTIKPGRNGIFKIFVQTPKEISDGEYDYTLSLKTMDLPKLPGETDKIASAAKLNFDFRLNFIGYAGDLNPDIDFINPVVSTNANGKTVISGTIVNKTPKRGIYCAVNVISGENSLNYSEIRVPVNGEKQFSVTLEPNVKKSDITGITIRNLENSDIILKKPI